MTSSFEGVQIQTWTRAVHLNYSSTAHRTKTLIHILAEPWRTLYLAQNVAFYLRFTIDININEEHAVNDCGNAYAAFCREMQACSAFSQSQRTSVGSNLKAITPQALCYISNAVQ